MILICPQSSLHIYTIIYLEVYCTLFNGLHLHIYTIIYLEVYCTLFNGPHLHIYTIIYLEVYCTLYSGPHLHIYIIIYLEVYCTVYCVQWSPLTYIYYHISRSILYSMHCTVVPTYIYIFSYIEDYTFLFHKIFPI